eukprot:TRINITY_DN2052_c0_g5_i1.p1 TRINITY_DN2052_c0_g5~~TRINITY_DN2052_c0_g5_i1.p1  ORF type:complete len:269 (+),score=38.73 TRINITY_DN2052_c0_g5_i1:125-931(+)
MTQALGKNDALLFISLTYCMFDLMYDSWDTFGSCSRPIHHWLLVSYMCVIGFRLLHFMGFQATDSSTETHFLLDMRQKSTASRLLYGFTWLVALPFFVLWTLAGTFWLKDVMQKTPQCVPSTTHLVFSGLWLLLSYGWIIVHVALAVIACMMERQVRRREADLLEIADADSLARWGQVDRLSGYTALSKNACTGLSPTEIKALPSSTWTRCCAEDECSICLNNIETNESVRCLPICGHTFHRSCIDLWLLRSADCPLCKTCVQGGEAP